MKAWLNRHFISKYSRGKEKHISVLIMSVLISLFLLEPLLAIDVKAVEIIRNPRVSVDETYAQDNVSYRVAVWDAVSFGSYPQKTEDTVAKPIKWRILSIDGNNAFLLADKALDCRFFGGNGTWEESSLRSWLNSTFYQSAFSDEQKGAIIQTTVVTPPNPKTGASGGEDSQDNVYLLSMQEALNPVYGFTVNEYRYSSPTREAFVTDQAVLNGVMASTKMPGRCSWWLRNAADDDSPPYKDITFVSDYGAVMDGGMSINANTMGVRPVLHVNLTAACVTDAGTVASDGTVSEPQGAGRSKTDLANPRTQEDVTTWDCVWFGSYAQEVTYQLQPIEWRVLSVNEDGSDAFVMADKALDCRQFHDSTGVTWKDSSIRNWLNNDFYNAAFTEEEKKLIRETTVVNADNGVVSGGGDTQDRIYLLSAEEVTDSAYGFDGSTDYHRMVRFALPTNYAKNNGAEVRTSYNTCPWLLRSRGSTENGLFMVEYNGAISNTQSATRKGTGIRPVMHIDLNSELVVPIGTIPSTGNRTSADQEWEKLHIEKVNTFHTLVDAIGTITPDDACKERIDAARGAYDKLSDVEIAMVISEKVSALTEAEKTYALLLKQKQEADKAAADKATADKATADKAAAEKAAAEKAAAEKAAAQKAAEKAAAEKTKAPGIVKLKSLKRGKVNSFVVKWKKVKQAKGYQVCYSTSRKFKKNVKTKTVSGKTKLTVKKLKKGKTYYVRVRAYKKDTAGKKIFGSWSKVKKIKVR